MLKRLLKFARRALWVLLFLVVALVAFAYWFSHPGSIEKEDLQRKKLPETIPLIEMGRFNENAGLLLDYLEAVKNTPAKSP